MPLRSPKMNSFIFGFHRFVWWPKWTPASSRSFNAIATKQPPLAFTELEALARSRHAVLLAFLGARVARQQSLVLERLAQLRVVRDQRPGNAETHRSGLSGHAAPGDRGQHIELIGRLGQHQRRANLHAQGFSGEERFEGPMVDFDGP